MANNSIVTRRVRLFNWFDCTVRVQTVASTYSGLRVVKGYINTSTIPVWLYEDSTAVVEWGYLGTEKGTWEMLSSKGVAE